MGKVPGNTAWLRSSFDWSGRPELQFCGLRSYFERQGFLDTYPATSRSYAEWENWTARRDSGVTFSERCVEHGLGGTWNAGCRNSTAWSCVIWSCLDFPGCFCAMWSLTHLTGLSSSGTSVDQAFGGDGASVPGYPASKDLAYQEDRWASRHPSYGSCAYFITGPRLSGTGGGWQTWPLRRSKVRQAVCGC